MMEGIKSQNAERRKSQNKEKMGTRTKNNCVHLSKNLSFFNFYFKTEEKTQFRINHSKKFREAWLHIHLLMPLSRVNCC